MVIDFLHDEGKFVDKKKLIIGGVAVVGVGTLAYFTRGYWMCWKKDEVAGSVPQVASPTTGGFSANLLAQLPKRGGTPVGSLANQNFSPSHLS